MSVCNVLPEGSSLPLGLLVSSQDGFVFQSLNTQKFKYRAHEAGKCYSKLLL